jgi:MSHA pilin protein MshA
MIKSTHRGFTLIELVVVIVILGILAAFAVPRFMGLETEARKAALQGLQGSVRSAAALAHSVQLASGLAPDASITVEGQTITMTNGYPTLASIANTLQDTTGFTYTAATGTFSKNGADDSANCSFTYAPPATNGNGPVISAIVDSGC